MNNEVLNFDFASGIKKAKKVSGFLPSNADVIGIIDASTHRNTLNELIAQLWTQAKLTHYDIDKKHPTSWNTVSKAIFKCLQLSPININGQALAERLTISTPRACYYTSKQECSEVPVSATATQASFVLGELEDLWPSNVKYPQGDYLMRLKFLGRKQTILVEKNLFDHIFSQYTQALIAFQTKQPFRFVVLAKVYRRNTKLKSLKQGLVLDEIAVLTTDEHFLPVQTMDELKQIKFSINLHKKSMIKPVNGALVRLPISSMPLAIPLAKNRFPLRVTLNDMMQLASKDCS